MGLYLGSSEALVHGELIWAGSQPTVTTAQILAYSGFVVRPGVYVPDVKYDNNTYYHSCSLLYLEDLSHTEVFGGNSQSNWDEAHCLVQWRAATNDFQTIEQWVDGRAHNSTHPLLGLYFLGEFA